MNEITPAEFIDRVGIELDQRGWGKGMTEAPNGCVCLYGAIHKAVDFYRDGGHFIDRGVGWPVHWEEWDVAEKAVLAVWDVARQRTESLGVMQHVQPEAIVFFNDSIAESVDDVKALLDEAKKELPQ
jgi:hypothetical protein